MIGRAGYARRMDPAARQKRNRQKRKARVAIETAAAEGRTISYSDVLAAMESRARPNSQFLTGILCEISSGSLKEKEVLLSAVVVNAGGPRKGVPSPGFFEFAERNGLEVYNEGAFWKQAVERVFSAYRSPTCN